MGTRSCCRRTGSSTYDRWLAICGGVRKRSGTASPPGGLRGGLQAARNTSGAWQHTRQGYGCRYHRCHPCDASCHAATAGQTRAPIKCTRAIDKR